MIKPNFKFEVSNKEKETSSSIHLITDEVTIEPFLFSVNLDIQNYTIKRVWYEGEISYGQNGRADVFNFSGEFEKRPGKQTVSYQLTFDTICGGTLKTIGKALLHNNSTNKDELHTSQGTPFSIVAQQPKGELIRSTFQNLPLNVLAYMKSSFAIFNSENLPVYENGFGLFRTVATDSNRIWNWKKDMATIEDDYKMKFENIKNIPAKMRASDPNTYKNLPDFTSDQLKMEVWQSFGNGHYYVAKKDKKWNWVATKENDGIADKCLEIETQILKGNTPVNW